MASQRIQRQIDRLLDEAEEAISQFYGGKVRQCEQAVLTIDPHNDDRLTFLAGWRPGGEAAILPLVLAYEQATSWYTLKAPNR